MSGAVVGPLRRVWFNDMREPRYYDLPRNTLDVRYEACAGHHLACDCREASIAEAFAEHKAEYDELCSAVLAATRGHNTWPQGHDGRIDEFAMCKCPACGIARAARVGYWDFKAQRDEANARADRERWKREHHATLSPVYPYLQLEEVPF